MATMLKGVIVELGANRAFLELVADGAVKGLAAGRRVFGIKVKVFSVDVAFGRVDARKRRIWRLGKGEGLGLH